jgi:hypothetical protein
MTSEERREFNKNERENRAQRPEEQESALSSNNALPKVELHQQHTNGRKGLSIFLPHNDRILVGRSNSVSRTYMLLKICFERQLQQRLSLTVNADHVTISNNTDG